MISRFWWCQQDNEQKMHWLSWERLTLPKEEGGLGFRDLHVFNMAMLARPCLDHLQIPSFFTLSITSIFSCLHGALNVGKKNN